MRHFQVSANPGRWVRVRFAAPEALAVGRVLHQLGFVVLVGIEFEIEPYKAPGVARALRDLIKAELVLDEAAQQASYLAAMLDAFGPLPGE